jgi:hypothetical protein
VPETVAEHDVVGSLSELSQIRFRRTQQSGGMQNLPTYGAFGLFASSIEYRPFAATNVDCA